MARALTDGYRWPVGQQRVALVFEVQSGPESYPSSLLRERHGVIVHVGIGESGSGVAALAASCDDAKDAVRLARDSVGVEIREISQLRVHQLLDSAGTAARTRFTQSQPDRLSRENDFAVLRQTIVAWCECGFNLVTTAQRLAIHRNTVIYRLDKISRLTARDIREPAVAIALYLACLIDELHSG